MSRNVDCLLCTVCKQSDYSENVVVHMYREFKNGIELDQQVGNMTEVLDRYCNVCMNYRRFTPGQITTTPRIMTADPNWKV